MTQSRKFMRISTSPVPSRRSSRSSRTRRASRSGTQPSRPSRQPPATNTSCGVNSQTAPRRTGWPSSRSSRRRPSRSRTTSGPTPFTYHYRFSANTRIDLEAEIELAGVAGLLGPIASHAVKRGHRREPRHAQTGARRVRPSSLIAERAQVDAAGVTGSKRHPLAPRSRCVHRLSLAELFIPRPPQPHGGLISLPPAVPPRRSGTTSRRGFRERVASGLPSRAAMAGQRGDSTKLQGG